MEFKRVELYLNIAHKSITVLSDSFSILLVLYLSFFPIYRHICEGVVIWEIKVSTQSGSSIYLCNLAADLPLILRTSLLW